MTDIGRVGSAETGSREPSQEVVSAASGFDPARWPKDLTPELSHILGLQCFSFIKLSRTYRAAGFDIPTKAEAEQAFFLHRLLGFWFEHGEDWLTHAQNDAMSALAAATGTAKTPKAVECEASQSGHEVATPTPYTLNQGPTHER